MDLDLHDDDLAFRDEVRTWLEEYVPDDPRPTDGPAMRAFDVAWQKEQYDGGWAGIAWPEEYGGRGLSLTHQMLWWEQYAAAQAPHTGVCFVGNTHGGPTLIAKGNDAQKHRYLPRILSGDEVWCQGFSEPGAGSDLAGIRTRAVLDGDELVVTGQKIWTSYADLADQQELLVRTGDGDRRHDGLTWAVCDMQTPGIEVRTIETMEGHHDLSEVFYDEVRIKDQRSSAKKAQTELEGSGHGDDEAHGGGSGAPGGGGHILFSSHPSRGLQRPGRSGIDE